MSKPDVWLPLYYGDYLSDTMHLSTEQHGAYLLLLMAAWGMGGSLPNDEAQLAAICRADRTTWRRIRSAVLGFFRTADDGRLTQKRLAEEFDKARRNQEKQRRNGSKGGRPKETQNKPMGFSRDNPNESPSPSPSLNPHPENTTSTTSTASTAADGNPSSSSGFDESRAKALSAQLVALELERGKRINAPASDPRIVAWTVAGITPAQLREAWKEAVFQRECDQDLSPINVGFLDVFVAKLIAPPERQSVVNSSVREWHETASGIEAKGRELGIDPPSPLTGGFPSFKARVFAAAQVAGVAL